MVEDDKEEEEGEEISSMGLNNQNIVVRLSRTKEPSNSNFAVHVFIYGNGTSEELEGGFAMYSATPEIKLPLLLSW